MQVYTADDLDNVAEQFGDNILVYGASGAGKTHLVGGIGAKYHTLYFDTERGSKTISKLPKDAKENIVMVGYDKFSDLNDLFQMLSKNNTPEAWNKLFEAKGSDTRIDRPFEAFVIDTLSELQRHMETELSKDTLENKLKNPANITNLRIQDWGAISNLTESLIADAFGKLPLVFVCTAHEQMIENESTGEMVGCPMVRGKLAFSIGKHFNTMVRLGYDKSGKRILLTTNQKNWQAKTRGNHQPVILDPSIEHIL